MDPLGKLGGTNGRTSCLLTKFGPPGLDTGRSVADAAATWLPYD